MLIAYGSPITEDDTGVTVTGATSQLTNPNAGLIDGRPGSLELYEWDDNSPAENVEILVSFERTIVPKVAALVNVTDIPAGTRVDVSLRRPADAQADYQVTQAEVKTNPWGDNYVLVIFDDDLDEVEAVQFEIFEDSDIGVGDQFGIGEVFLAPAMEANISVQIQDTIESITASRYSQSGQPFVTPGKDYRRVRIETEPTSFSIEYGNRQEVKMALAKNPRCYFIGSTASQTEIDRLSFYALCELGSTTSRRDAYQLFEGPLIFRELR